METKHRQNPFPGIDPWMQNKWHDVHTSLVGYIRDELGQYLPDDLVARAEEGVSISSPGEKERRLRADVAVSQAGEDWKSGDPPSWSPRVDTSGGLLAVLEEMEEPPTSRWVEIRTTGDEQLVTVIEVTSPANKTYDGRIAFDHKLTDLRLGGANVVEIDLVRGGEGRRFRPCEGGAGFEDCNVFMMPAEDLQHALVFPCPLRERLPRILIPLRSEEPEITLDLQPLIDRCYERGRYWTLNRDAEPEPPLSEADLEWAREIWAA